MDLMECKALLRRRTGLILKPDMEERLANEIPRLMVLRGAPTLKAYLQLIRQDEDAFTEMVNLLTVNETYFFREPDQLRVFADHLIPNLLAEKSGPDPLCILSAGCSTGEEPYSIAMILAEKYGIRGAQSRFSVVGADIDSEALKKARSAIYHRRSFRNPEIRQKERFFKGVFSDRFRVIDEIRQMVKFYPVNLLQVPYPSPLQRMDLIFYRNVSIYFDAEIQKQIFNHLSQALLEGGYLVVSATETLSHDFKVLRLKEIDGVFLYHKPVGKPTVSPIAGFRSPSRPSVAQSPATMPKPRPLPRKPESRPRDAPSYENALTLARNKNYDNALTFLDALLQKGSATASVYTLKAAILFNRRENEAAETLCHQALEMDTLCTEAFLLLGMTAMQADDHETAIRRFKEAIYSQTANWLAHFYLAKIYQARRETRGMRREYGIVIRLLEKGGFDGHGLSFFPLPFTEEQIIHLCRQNMAE